MSCVGHVIHVVNYVTFHMVANKNSNSTLMRTGNTFNRFNIGLQAHLFGVDAGSALCDFEIDRIGFRLRRWQSGRKRAMAG